MSDIMQAYRDFQARVSGDPQREAMRQTLLNSNSPFALLGRGVDNVANASLPPTADMLRAQIQSNPETNNPSMPDVVGNTVKFFQDMQTPDWLKPTDSALDATRESLSRIENAGLTNTGVENQLRLMEESRGIPEEVVSVPPTPEDEDPYGLDGDEAVVSTPIVDKGMTTAEIDAEGGTGERKTNWFDAVESRVDLMAMGAAMLANSSSGKGTLANLGEALQVGLGAKKSVAKAKQDKEYKDKLMALELLKLQNVDTLRNQGYKVDNISSELSAAGFEDGKKINNLATYINSVDPSFAGRSQANRSKLTAFLADNMGDNWVGSGGKPEMTKAEETYREGLELLAKGKL
jgi:hypothetical protein